MYSDSFLNECRRSDMAALLNRYGSLIRDADVLEIGAGSGAQLAILRESARSAVGVDVATSHY
jgi:hypothetical protein